jgi:hypothetical protein
MRFAHCSESVLAFDAILTRHRTGFYIVEFLLSGDVVTAGHDMAEHVVLSSSIPDYKHGQGI